VLRVGTRPSPLAIKQFDEIQGVFPGVIFEKKIIYTLGDKDKLTPISALEGSDFFTREIDEALLRGEIDLGLHSSKDLPEKLRDGLKIIFETKSISPFDALVSKENVKLKDLPYAARVGTSSSRRKEQVKSVRGDLILVDVRGNIEERLNLINAGRIDALVIAHAALIRLGLAHLATEIFTENRLKAHPKQGILALVSREDRCKEVRFILSEQAQATGN